ncbi:hypothetical protein PR048_004747 [Dryococelus australis]|uniref:Uncharacterized protein n=1 Tax=Dryococelus australis TaxID=614101 RepID=A0ABQ9I685_9NEOP|nr:hypothetical protein PR048_004747 [Dryococelus australis]
MGEKNSKVWKELCVNTDKPYFANSVCSDRKIWVFYYILYLLKLFSNYFIDDSVTLPDGTVFTMGNIEELLKHQKGYLSITHHISETHPNVTGRARQNFRLPANGNGLYHRSQENTLKRFLEVCPVLQFGKRNSLLPFQKGFIISMKSLMALYEDLKKMNDCLENFVSRLRGFGVFYNNLTPFEVQNRIRLLVLTGSASDISLLKCASVQEEKNYGSSAQCSFDTEDQFTEFVSSELCIKITESVSRHQEPTNVEKELIHHEVNTDLVESTPDTVSLNALKYVAGYVAFKCKNIDSSLGSIQDKCDSNVPTDWISIISRGGHTTPSSWDRTF